jgi:solute carrier family 25 (mitochondrial S-adenosylmethionine transporter), member 26
MQRVTPLTMLKRIIETEGSTALLSGLGPRVAWISAGGAVFLGAYELAKDLLLTMQSKTSK